MSFFSPLPEPDPAVLPAICGSTACPDESREEVEVKPGEILVTYGNLHRGFEYPMIKFIVITEGDMFGVEKKKRKRKKHIISENRRSGEKKSVVWSATGKSRKRCRP